MISKVLSRNKKILYVLDEKEPNYIVVKNSKYQVVGFIKNGKTYLRNGKLISDSAVPGLLFPEIGLELTKNLGILK